MRLLVIGNPIAGRGHAKAGVDELVACAAARGHVVEVAVTSGPGDATRFAEQHRDDVDCVIAAGGDGTLREVFLGLGERAETPMMPLALGTANLLARELDLPEEPAGLVDLIESRRVHHIDVAYAGDDPFLAVLGVGFDAMVTEAIGRSRKGALGYRGYFGPILRIARQYRAPRLRVRVDGGESHDCGFMVASNTRSYGGVMRLSDRAGCDTGELEVCLIDPATAMHLIALAPFAFSGTLARAPGFTTLWGTHVEIEAAGPVPVQLDGDHWGQTPVSIRLAPRVATVVAGPLAGRSEAA